MKTTQLNKPNPFADPLTTDQEIINELKKQTKYLSHIKLIVWIGFVTIIMFLIQSQGVPKLGY